MRFGRRFLWLSALALAPVVRFAAASPWAVAPSGSIRSSTDASVRVVVIDAGSGEPMIARVRFEGRGFTADPDLGPDHEAGGAHDTVLATIDGANARLASGSYRVVVSHGPEWSIEAREVRVSGGAARTLVVPLRREVDAGGYVACDFHVHSNVSPDSSVSIDDRIRSLVAEGVSFAVPTEHNHVIDYALRSVEPGTADLHSVPGVEVTTWAPAFGHFNVYPWPYDPDDPRGGAPAFEGLDPPRLLEALRSNPNAFIQVNHPRLSEDVGCYHDDACRDEVARNTVDGVEVWNGFDLGDDGHLRDNFEEWLLAAERGLRAVATGNSDSHRIHGQWAGYPRTYVSVDGGVVRDPMDVVRSLRAGRAFVTTGPWLDVRVNDRSMGDRVVVHGGRVRVEVEVRTPSWMRVDRAQIFAGATLVLERSLPADGRLRVWVDVDDAPFVVVLVEGRERMNALIPDRRVRPRAFSNPIWLQPAMVASRRPLHEGGFGSAAILR